MRETIVVVRRQVGSDGASISTDMNPITAPSGCTRIVVIRNIASVTQRYVADDAAFAVLNATTIA